MMFTCTFGRGGKVFVKTKAEIKKESETRIIHFLSQRNPKEDLCFIETIRSRMCDYCLCQTGNKL